MAKSSQITAATYDQPADCVSANLRRATRAVTQLYDDALRPSGLRSTQFSLLATVFRRGPVTMTGLAETLVVDRTTLSRNLQPLLKGGLVKTSRSSDRRQRPIVITERGKETLLRALPLWKAVQRKMIGGLKEGRWRRMARDLAETVRLAQGE